MTRSLFSLFLLVFSLHVSAEPEQQQMDETAHQQVAVSAPAKDITDPILLIAVSDMIGRGLDSVTTLIFSDRFRSSMVGNAKIKVLERSQMNLILQEQGFQRTGACDYDACLLEIGQLLGAQFIVAGDIGRIDDIYSFNIRMINIQTGEVVHSISQDNKGTVLEVLGSVIPMVAEKFMDVVSRVALASVEIKSIPPNAKVLLNNMDVGKTPVNIKGLEVGTYVMHLSLENHAPVTDTFQMHKGTIISKLYSLDLTSQYKEILRVQKRTTRKRILQVTFGTAALSAAIVGGYYEKQVHDIVEKQDELVREYNNVTVTDDFSYYKKEYQKEDNLFSKYVKYRNAGYIAGIIFATGFSLTFLF